MTGLALVTAPTVDPLSIAEVMRYCRIDQANQELAPGSFTAVLASPAAAGNVDDGVHRYLATFVTADGETEAGTISDSITVADQGVNGQVELTGIPLGGALVTSRKIYRTEADGSSFLLLATIANNTDTTYTDNIADSSLGAEAPTTNSTSDPYLTSLIKAATKTAESRTNRCLITQTWELTLDQFRRWEIYIPKPSLISIDSVSYIDSDGATQTLAADQYKVDTKSEPGKITPAYSLIWPVTRWESNAVTVQFTAGYGAAADVPDGIKLWMLTRIKHFYNNPAPVHVGGTSSVVEFPRAYTDGLLDDFIVPNFYWVD